MGHAKTANLKSICAGSSDRISSLPQEIKGNILSNLNVEEAVRASILSSSWRNAWTIMPEIHLCDSGFYPTDAFPTSSNAVRTFAQFKWMYMLSKKQADCITIKLTSGRKYKIPSSLFRISNLQYLRIKNCIVSLPRDFKGFKSLTVLNLKFFSSTDTDVNNLISSCPMLAILCLKYFEGINCLNIRAQVLEVLEVEGNFEELHLHAPNLVDLVIDKTETHLVPVGSDKKSYLNQAFGSLTCMEVLHVSRPFLTYLSKGCMLTKLPGVFDRLEKICIESCLWNWTEVMAACSLFQNAPILSELVIWSLPSPEAFTRETIWDQDQTEIQKPSLYGLVTVTLDDFMGLNCEVAFLRLLLSWAPALDEMKIRVPEDKLVHPALGRQTPSVQ
ncbi:hypothetical protein ACP70R_026888 [Stipagrostis hirtigluma subsp. patula]